MVTFSFKPHPVLDELDLASLRLLAESGATLGRHLDLMGSAQDLTDLLVPHMAVAATVDLCGEFFKEDERQQKVSSGLLRAGATIASNIISPTRDYRYATPQCLPIPNPSEICGDIDTVNLHSPTEISFKEAFGGDPAGSRYVQDLGISSVATVPIYLTTGTTMGLLTIHRIDGVFTAENLAVTKELARRTGIALRNAHTYICERRKSAALYRATRPASVPRIHGLDIFDEFTNAGDGIWFDVVPLPGARAAVVMGDTSDLGSCAAASASSLRSAVQALSQLEIEPGEIMTRLNELVCEMIAELHPKFSDVRGTGIKCFYLIHDPIQSECIFANAGYESLFMISPSMEIEFLKRGRGLALGTLQEKYSESRNSVEPGTTLAVTSFSPETVLEGLKAAVKMRRSNSITKFEPTDIAAIGTSERAEPPLVMRTNAISENEFVEWNLISDIAIVGTARKLAEQQLSIWNISEDIKFVTTLIISELVTNAIRHASGPVKLRLILQEKLTCEVSDGSPTAPYLRYALPDEEGGRGLFIIAEYASRWGVRRQAIGKTIWAEQIIRKQHTP